MSGYTKVTIFISVVAFFVYVGLERVGLALCALPIAIILALAVGYIGAYLTKDDPAKTARIARNSGKAGLITGVFAAIGQIVASYLVSTAVGTTEICLGLLSLILFAFFGWVGGWSWARQEHERQTGYKPT